MRFEASPVRPRGRGWATLLWAAVVGAPVVAAVIWWRLAPAGAGAPEPAWPATVFVLAGDGLAGPRDGDAMRARFSDPFGVAAESAGTVYVTDAGDSNGVRAISADGRVFTLAGGRSAGFADGRGDTARFDTPSGLAIDANGTLYVADTGNNAIRRVTPDGQVSTLAGDGTAGHRDGPAHTARFNGPIGVAVDPQGRVVVADTYNDRIRVISPEGAVSTLAGAAEPGAVDGPAAQARFDTPCGVAIGRSGEVYVADTGNGLIRIIDPAGNVTTQPWPMSERLVRPIGIAAGEAGHVYVTDDRGRIVEVSPDGATRTLAGSSPGFADGPGSVARFRQPTGLAVAAPGRLLVSDSGNALVRLVAAAASIELRPPASPRISPRFDDDRFGMTPLLWPVAPMAGPHEIAGTLGEARGGDGAERFHTGIDVRADEGTPVLAVRNGIVRSPLATDEFGSLSEWLRIGPITYVHIRAGRARGGAMHDATRFVPTYGESDQLVRLRVRRGARFVAGEIIGTVNPFNHVHLNVGWPGEEQNPLRFRLVQFEDTLPPTIPRGGIRLYDELGQALTGRARGRIVVRGKVQVVVDAWDQANGNRPGRRLGLYDLGYRVLRRDGSPAPGFEAVRHTLRFDRLSAAPDAARIVYAPGSGIPYYGRRRTRFLYTVTNVLRNGAAAKSFWDTTLLDPGDYILRAWVADASGNAAVSNTDLPITILPSDGAAPE